MKMYNYEVDSFKTFLEQMVINSGKASRMRSRLVKILLEQLQIIENERKDIIEKYSEKDDEGNAKYIVVNEQLQQIEYLIADKASCNKELTELFGEEFVIDESESNADMLTTIRNAVLDYEGELSGAKAALYDRFCEIIENVYV